MNKTKHNFSENSREIRNHLVVDEDRYPFLKTLRMFLEKVNTISACYLSGPIVHKGSIDLKYEPIIHLYIISDKLTSYVYSFIKNKAKTLVEDHFFPNYVLTEVHFTNKNNLDSSSKFCLQCDCAFWFGDRKIHDSLPTYCMKDICDCNHNYEFCANRLRNHMNQSVDGKTLWINIYILLNITIKAIYEKNCCILDTYHCTCEEKYNAIKNHHDIPIVDKNIVTESFQIIKKVNSNLGETVIINKPFFNFICNYLDLCNEKKTFQELLAEDYSNYRNWLQFITIENKQDSLSLEPENRADFKYLFEQSNSKFFNRIQRDQLLMNKLVQPHPQGVNPAGLTADVMKRLRANKKK